MGQKVNPIGFRLGINRTWDSRWFADGEDYSRLLHDDIRLRAELKKRLGAAGVSRIIIERPHKKCRVTIYAARPGVIIGKKGADIDNLIVAEAFVGKNIIMKRFAARARGRSSRIEKPFSEITIVVRELGEAA